MWGQLSTTCSNVLKQPNGKLLVAVDHNQLLTMSSGTVDPIDWSHPPPSWAVPPERPVHSINQCNLSGNRKCNRSMRGNHLAYAATQGMSGGSKWRAVTRENLYLFVLTLSEIISNSFTFEVTTELIHQWVIIIHHNFLPPPRRGHVKSDNTHTINNIHSLAQILDIYALIFSSCAIFSLSQPHHVTASHPSPDDNHQSTGGRSERIQGQAKMAAGSSFSYVCTRALHSFRSFAQPPPSFLCCQRGPSRHPSQSLYTKGSYCIVRIIEISLPTMHSVWRHHVHSVAAVLVLYSVISVSYFN